MNLMHSTFIQALDYDHRLKAQALVNRGIDESGLYFWFNISQGHYKHLPSEVLEKDLARLSKKYPQFENDFKKAIK